MVIMTYTILKMDGGGQLPEAKVLLGWKETKSVSTGKEMKVQQILPEFQHSRKDTVN